MAATAITMKLLHYHVQRSKWKYIDKPYNQVTKSVNIYKVLAYDSSVHNWQFQISIDKYIWLQNIHFEGAYIYRYITKLLRLRNLFKNINNFIKVIKMTKLFSIRGNGKMCKNLIFSQVFNTFTDFLSHNKLLWDNCLTGINLADAPQKHN